MALRLYKDFSNFKPKNRNRQKFPTTVMGSDPNVVIYKYGSPFLPALPGNISGTLHNLLRPELIRHPATSISPRKKHQPTR